MNSFPPEQARETHCWPLSEYGTTGCRNLSHELQDVPCAAPRAFVRLPRLHKSHRYIPSSPRLGVVSLRNFSVAADAEPFVYSLGHTRRWVLRLIIGFQGTISQTHVFRLLPCITRFQGWRTRYDATVQDQCVSPTRGFGDLFYKQKRAGGVLRPAEEQVRTWSSRLGSDSPRPGYLSRRRFRGVFAVSICSAVQAFPRVRFLRGLCLLCGISWCRKHRSVFNSSASCGLRLIFSRLSSVILPR